MLDVLAFLLVWLVGLVLMFAAAGRMFQN